MNMTILFAHLFVPFAVFTTSLLHFVDASDNTEIKTTTPPHQGCLQMEKDGVDVVKYPKLIKLPSGVSVAETQTDCDSNTGLAGSYPCKDVNLLSHLSNAQLNNQGADIDANDLWGWTDTASGREFVIIGLISSTAYVEITDPVNPVYLGELAFPGESSMWADIKVYKNYAYIGSESPGHGIQILDLSANLLSASPGTSFTETSRYTGGNLGSSHNVFINEDSGYGYALGSNTCSGGLHIFNLFDDPENPSFVGCYSDEGYTHDVQCITYDGPDTRYTGKEICFACNESNVAIIDVTDNTLISKKTYGSSGLTYTHQGWLTEDRQFFVFGDELDEVFKFQKTTTFVMDVRDLQEIPQIQKHKSALRAIDHNLYIRDGIIYQANYRAGLRILKANDYTQANLEEIAYFDIYPSSDSPSFNGAWSVYPFFPSKVVAVSAIETGLFLFRVTAEDVVNTNDCADSPLNVAAGGGSLGCDFVSSNTEYCSSGGDSHCPKTCGTCAAYGCLDSEVDFVYEGSIYSCSQFDGLAPGLIDIYCAIQEVADTCRASCGVCDL